MCRLLCGEDLALPYKTLCWYPITTNRTAELAEAEAEAEAETRGCFLEADFLEPPSILHGSKCRLRTVRGSTAPNRDP
jgi:hypothetical protein